MRHLAPWLLLIAVVLLYPVAVLAGGAPRFPSRHDCIRPATTDENLEAVFGRFGTVAAAESVRARAARVGFQNLKLEPDGCGLFKVTLHGIPSLRVGRDFVHEAERAGFRPMLEQSPR
jgi:hypothetical protein